MSKDIVEGLRMMADELRRNAERSMSAPQQDALSGRAMICDGAANEIKRLREESAALLARLIRPSPMHAAAIEAPCAEDVK